MLKFTGLRAYISVHRNEEKRADSYGVSLKLNDEDYAIASVYLDEPTSVNEAIRQAIGWIASMRRNDGETIAVYGKEAAFVYWKMKERVTAGIMTADLQLFHLRSPQGSALLADDASKRMTTVIERVINAV